MVQLRGVRSGRLRTTDLGGMLLYSLSYPKPGPIRSAMLSCCPEVLLLELLEQADCSVFDNSCCKRCFISVTCDFLAGVEQLLLMTVLIPCRVHSSEVVTHPSSELIVVIVVENGKASPLKQHTESSIPALHMPDTSFCLDALQVYFIHPSLYNPSATPCGCWQI